MKLLRSLVLGLGLFSIAACSAVHPDCAAVSAPPPASEVKVAPAPAPAPAVQPTEELQRAFTVHFDFDSAEVRASAMQILWEASQVASQLRPVAVRIHGYTDASGNRAHNRKLSERRAAAVAAQLVKLGVKVAVVDVKGHGIAVPVKGRAKRESRKVEIVFETAANNAAAPLTPDTAVAAKTAKSAVTAAHMPTPRLAVSKPTPSTPPMVMTAVKAKAEKPENRPRQVEAMVRKTADPPPLPEQNFNRIPE